MNSFTVGLKSKVFNYNSTFNSDSVLRHPMQMSFSSISKLYLSKKFKFLLNLIFSFDVHIMFSIFHAAHFSRVFKVLHLLILSILATILSLCHPSLRGVLWVHFHRNSSTYFYSVSVPIESQGSKV